MNWLHFHSFCWLSVIFLFILCFSMHRRGNVKGLKGSRMLLRGFYLLTFVSGFALIYLHQFSPLALLKGAAAIWLIASLELTLTRHMKQVPTGIYWVQVIMSFGLVTYLGTEWL